MKHQIILKMMHFLSGLLKFKHIANPENITVKIKHFPNCLNFVGTRILPQASLLWGNE